MVMRLGLHELQSLVSYSGTVEQGAGQYLERRNPLGRTRSSGLWPKCKRFPPVCFAMSRFLPDTCESTNTLADTLYGRKELTCLCPVELGQPCTLKFDQG